MGQDGFIDFLRINQIIGGLSAKKRHLARRLPFHLIERVQDAPFVGANVSESVEDVLLPGRLKRGTTMQ